MMRTARGTDGSAGLGASADRDAARPKVGGIVAFGFLALIAASLMTGFAAIDWMAPGELVWPVSPDMWGAVIFLFTLAMILVVAPRAIAALATADTDDRPRRGGPIDALVAAPILILIGISGSARLIIQIVSFAGLNPPAAAVPFAVVGVEHSFSRGSDHYTLRLRYGEHGRVFSDRVRRAVYEAASVGDTVNLPVETGRFGIQRAMIASPLVPNDVHHAGPAAP